MKLRPAAFAALLVLIVSSGTTAESSAAQFELPAEPTIPEVIPNPFDPSEPPFWVGEKKATDEAGNFRLELFSQYFPLLGWAQQLEGVPAGACYEVGPTFIDYIDAIPCNSLHQIARDAPRVLHGVVVARAEGFLGDDPGTLVRVRRSNELKGAEAGGDFLFFLHLGEVQVGKRRICLNDPTIAPLPEVGDELVVFARGPETDLGPLVMATMMEAYLTIKDGQVYLPRRMTEEQAPFRRHKHDVIQVFARARP